VASSVNVSADLKEILSMKAVIETGGKQYMVAKGDVLEVELVGDSKTVSFEPLMIVDEDKSKVGQPNVAGAKVTAKVVEESKQGPKAMAIRYKAKKRVHKVRGERPVHSVIEITDIKA
jgi:large subunit ribosomal protein L21